MNRIRTNSALRASLAGGLGVFAVLLLSSCREERCNTCPIQHYKPQTSPANVLENLQTSYLQHEIAEYSRLLAPDFQFVLDEGTRQQFPGLPVLWDANTDSALTARLFDAPQVTDIRIILQHGNAKPSSVNGERGEWWSIDVLDTFLEVDLAPTTGELGGTTFRIDGQRQRFWFRKGRTPGDSNPQTAELWYIVEWRDYGFSLKGSVQDRLLIENSTWSRLKALFLP